MRKERDATLYEVLSILIDRITLTPEISNETLIYHGVAHVPVVLLLKKLQPPQAVIDFAAEQYLRIFHNSARRGTFYTNVDALCASLTVALLGASKGVGERVVTALARHGMLRAERAAITMLGRGLRPREVQWLVDAYVSDLVSQSNGMEEELMRLAHAYLDAHGANEVGERITAFKEEFARAD